MRLTRKFHEPVYHITEIPVRLRRSDPVAVSPDPVGPQGRIFHHRREKSGLIRRLAFLALVPIALVPVAVATQPNAAIAQAEGTTLPASDPRFLYEGRFDLSKADAPVVVWQSSRIRLDFSGDALALRFDAVSGQAYFDVTIDGRTTLLALREGSPATGAELHGLGAGRHSLVLFKRSEAGAGTARFLGVTLAAGAEAFAPARPAYPIAMWFFGDSITVGACNEDGAMDQWEDRATHNNALSYGAMTAAAFQADYRNVAVSGMGLATGWTPLKAGEVWDRVYPRADSPRVDLTGWKPDVIFINLGENDDSFTTAKKQPFPAEAYTDAHVALVQAMRAAYPRAEIVLLRGGMFGGAQSERLRAPWEAAVKRIEAADRQVAHFVFTHWSSTHPRVADDRAMADELIAWLKEQAFMKRS